MLSYTATAMGSSITFSPENGFATSTGARSIISTSNGGLGTRCNISLAIFLLPWFVVDNLVDDQSAYRYRYQANCQHSESMSHSHYIFSSSSLWMGSSWYGAKSKDADSYSSYHLSSICLYSSISSLGSMLWKPLNPPSRM